MNESQDRALSPQTLANIDRICDAFEGDWTTGTPLQLEHYLDRVAADTRPRLFHELLLIDLQKRFWGVVEFARDQDSD